MTAPSDDPWDFQFEDDESFNEDIDEDDYHGHDCDCADCTFESTVSECGYCPDAGLCTMAGSEHCDWDCPIAKQIFKEERAAMRTESSEGKTE